MIEWLMEPQSSAETLAKWVLVVVVAGCLVGLIRKAVRAHRGDQMSAKRGSKLVAAVPFAAAKSPQKPAQTSAARENYVARIPGRGATPQADGAELAQVLPFLPRAEREALRAGGWS